jgi:DedD protein
LDEGLKKRLIGATVLVSLVVIFIPMLLDNSGEREPGIEIINIPPRPDRPFTQGILPDEGQPLSTPPTIVRLQPLEREVLPPVKPKYKVEPVPAAKPAAAPRKKRQSSPEPKPATRAKSAPKPTPKSAPPTKRTTAKVPPVRVKERGSTPSRRGPISSWVIQMGSFSSRANADKLVKQLRMKSFSAFVAQASVKGKLVYRVRVGPEVDRGQVEKTLARLNRAMKSLGVRGNIRPYP